VTFFRFEVRPDDGEPYELAIEPRDVLAWERVTKKSYSALMTNMNVVDMYRMAHLAARKRGLFVGELAEFEATVDVGFPGGRKEVEEEPEPDPTRRARSTDP
jgi:hypothetical protein